MICSWRCAPRHKGFWARLTIRELGGFYSTFLLVASVAAVFCIFVASEIEYSDAWKKTATYATTIGLASLTELFLLLAYVTDPGVLPRARELDIERVSNLQPGERICYTCKIIRPKRAKHCRWCDHCVEVFDHHCPYVGTCIGAGNYVFFVSLLIVGTLAAAWVAGLSIYYAAHNGVDDGKSPGSLVAVILGAAGGLIVLTMGHLCCYHALISWTGETTNERILTKRSQGAFRKKKGVASITDDSSPCKQPLIGPTASPLYEPAGPDSGQHKDGERPRRDGSPGSARSSVVIVDQSTDGGRPSVTKGEEKIRGSTTLNSSLEPGHNEEGAQQLFLNSKPPLVDT